MPDVNLNTADFILPTTVNGYYFAKFCVFTDYTLFIDNELIYDSRNEMQENMETHKNEGKYWSIIRLPDNCSGKSIKIVNYSKYPEYQPTFGNIYIGTKSALLFKILNK